MEIRVSCGPDGLISRVEAHGHAGCDVAGLNPACTAVTILLRTAYETMAASPGVDVIGDAPQPGSLWFAVRHHDASRTEWLLGIKDFLLVGLSGIVREFPGKIELIMDDKGRI